MTVEEIKAAWSMRDVLAKYGYTVDSHGFCKCMLHEGDNTASFKIYPDNTYHCFGCGRHGDVIKFVQDYLHCDFKTAFYELGGSYERPKSLRELKEQEKRKKEFERRKLARQAELQKAADAKRILSLALEELNRALRRDLDIEIRAKLCEERAYIFDALMQITEKGGIGHGEYPERIRRYIE